MQYIQIKTSRALNVDFKELKRQYLYASINPYIGCFHRCRYCYVQSEKYSRGEKKFFDIVKVKTNIIEKLIAEIARYKQICNSGVIYLGTATDPYQSVESEYHLSRQIMEILLKYTSYNIHLFTKSVFILNDIDVLEKNKNRVAVSVSLNCINEKYEKIFEPFASSQQERLEVIRTLNRKSIKCGIAIMPVIPYVTDSEESLTELFSKIKNSCASYVWFDFLTLRNVKNKVDGNCSQKDIFFNVLGKYLPELEEIYNFLYRSSISPNIQYKKKIEKKIFDLSKKFDIRCSAPNFSYKNDFFPSGKQLFFNF